MNHYNGLSSLLFIVSTVKSYYASNLILWKISNTLLIFASYLFNATHNDTFLLLDLIAISFVCTSYINHFMVNYALTVAFIYEYTKTQNINTTKNAAYGLTITKSIINTYYYVGYVHFYIILSSTITGAFIYFVRLQLPGDYDNKYFVFLTWLLHGCTMNIIYITSITAN